VVADYLARDGRSGRSNVIEARAYRYMENEHTTQFKQMGMAGKVNFSTKY